jgi:D-glycero-alpha-D-manno-heptose-7-phosphate kinase
VIYEETKMGFELTKPLESALKDKALPSVIVYNRIDGPGSSLDLREFQQALWSLPKMPSDVQSDPAMEWSRNLPRTIGITINTGTKIEAHPLDSNLIGVKSIDYVTDIIGKPGEIPPIKENWLLKIIDLFNIRGVKFVLQNLQPDTFSAGLGGSATATTGVCILANELAGRPFSQTQLISMASRMEQDLGVSITGTQEQSNVIFGGVTDYLWFPWGIPGKPESNFGESLRSELMSPNDYLQLEKRMAIFHSGRTHSSIDVNSIWRMALATQEGYKLHYQKLEQAYKFREGLRLREWDNVVESVKEYRKIRTALCPGYMDAAWDLLKRAEAKECTAFPLGAGGGGGILVVSSEPDALQEARDDLRIDYREIHFHIKSRGHEIFNLPLAREGGG